MPLPSSPPYGGEAVYTCDGPWCSRTCSVPVVTTDPVRFARALPEGWTVKDGEIFCQDCATTVVVRGIAKG